MAKIKKDLPRGRKRPGWKAEFLEAMGEAAVDLGDLSEKDVLQAHRISAMPGGPIRGLKFASMARRKGYVLLG
jgi:hypothetical protein